MRNRQCEAMREYDAYKSRGNFNRNQLVKQKVRESKKREAKKLAREVKKAQDEKFAIGDDKHNKKRVSYECFMPPREKISADERGQLINLVCSKRYIETPTAPATPVSIFDYDDFENVDWSEFSFLIEEDGLQAAFDKDQEEEVWIDIFSEDFADFLASLDVETSDAKSTKANNKAKESAVEESDEFELLDSDEIVFDDLDMLQWCDC
jgi:hypothetical protein